MDRVQIGLSPPAERDAMPEPMLSESQGRGKTTKRPVVGVIGSAHTVEGKFTAQRVGERNLRAVAEVAGALPLMFAGTPEITDIGTLLDVVDGILLTGARQRASEPFRPRGAPPARALRPQPRRACT